MRLRISAGTCEIGDGEMEEASVGGSQGGMERAAKVAISSEMDPGGASAREWWAVLGTVADALEGLGDVGFGIMGAGSAAGV